MAGLPGALRWDGDRNGSFGRFRVRDTPRMRRSAGILLFRHDRDGLRVLVAHPGGPLWARRDDGAWSIVKGEADEGESSDAELLRVAAREFREETGHELPDGEPISLGEIRQWSGKLVRAWALEGDLDPGSIVSSTFELEWPPRSGRRVTVPEIDRVAWMTPDDARRALNPAQAAFLDVLERALGGTSGRVGRARGPDRIPSERRRV